MTHKGNFDNICTFKALALIRVCQGKSLADFLFGGNEMNYKKWLNLLLVLVGNVIYVFAVKFFVLPANLMSCGTTGIALVMNHLFKIPLTGFIFVFNVTMLSIGWWILGKKFAMTTIFSSLFYPVALGFLNRTLGNVVITDDKLLNVVFAGLTLGLALGIILRTGASTGGMDIPPLILKKKFRIPVTVSLWSFDFCILLSQMMFHPLEDLLYGILLIIVISIALDKVLLLGTSKTEVKIVSEEADEIRHAILSKVDRGVTMLHGKGGYLGHDTEIILSVVSNHELPKIESLARDIDPNCFMIISHVTEVWGRGFSYSKKYEKN